MIYLDNSATTKPYPEAINSFVTVSNEYYGNPSSLHSLGGKAERLLTQSREQVAKLLGVKPSEIIFTSGGTEGNNLAIKGAALENQSRGKHIITTAIEHPSVSEACKQLEALGFEVTYLPVDNRGFISVDLVKKAIRDDTILVSIIHVNNEVGTIQPIGEIGKLLKQYPKILFHVDHVQGLGKVPLDLKAAHIDLCTMSAHKFHGLKGNGILYVRAGVKLSPLFGGGAQEMRIRSGTENVAGIVAMAKSLRMSLEHVDMKIEKMKKIKQAYIERLKEIDEVTLNTPEEGSAPHIVNFSINGYKSEVFIHMLAEKNIFASTTSACSSKKQEPSKTLLAMGRDEKLAKSAVRLSLSYENELEEVDVVIKAIKESLQQLKNVTR
jgi:cysteine desulfurase